MCNSKTQLGIPRHTASAGMKYGEASPWKPLVQPMPSSSIRAQPLTGSG